MDIREQVAEILKQVLNYGGCDAFSPSGNLSKYALEKTDQILALLEQPKEAHQGKVIYSDCCQEHGFAIWSEDHYYCTGCGKTCKPSRLLTEIEALLKHHFIYEEEVPEATKKIIDLTTSFYQGKIEEKVPQCGLCGGTMSRNPHPHAGEPNYLLEVGAVWNCIPCTQHALHTATENRYKAEQALAEAEKQGARKIMEWMDERCTEHHINSGGLSVRNRKRDCWRR